MPTQGADRKRIFEGELPRLFASEAELPRQFVIEEDDGIADVVPVLRAAKTQHIHAGLPGQLLWRDAERDDGIREARAVHVYAQVEAPAGGPDRLDCPGVYTVPSSVACVMLTARGFG